MMPGMSYVRLLPSPCLPYSTSSSNSILKCILYCSIVPPSQVTTKTSCDMICQSCRKRQLCPCSFIKWEYREYKPVKDDFGWQSVAMESYVDNKTKYFNYCSLEHLATQTGVSKTDSTYSFFNSRNLKTGFYFGTAIGGLLFCFQIIPFQINSALSLSASNSSPEKSLILCRFLIGR